MLRRIIACGQPARGALSAYRHHRTRFAAPDVNLTRWHALQTWLATGPNLVVIPFAVRLAKLVPPAARQPIHA